ncbi:MAG: aldolase/citrate lyase family protein [Dehalococcoidia bacterium]
MAANTAEDRERVSMTGDPRFAVRKNKIKAKLMAGEPAIACWVYSVAPAVASILGYIGFDAVIFDAEHAHYDSASIESMCRAADEGDTTPMLKLPSNHDATLALRGVNAGIAGVHFADVETQGQAQAAVNLIKFYPYGKRGVAFTHRSGRYAMVHGSEYIEQVNAEMMAVICIESIEGVDNLPEILKVPGVDVISVGPHDLSQSLGIPDQLEHPKLLEALDRVVGTCRDKGVPVGTGAWTKDMLEDRLARGFQYIHWPNDLRLMKERGMQVLDLYRSSLQAVSKDGAA